MAQPFKHPTTGKYYLRRKVPKELRAALGLEFKRSLGTADPSVAKARFAAMWSQSEEAFAAARAGLQGADTLTLESIQALASEWLATEAAKLDRSKNYTSRLAGGASVIDQDGEEVIRFDSLADAGGEYDDDLSDAVLSSIKAALRAKNMPMPPKSSAAFGQLQAVFRVRLLKLSEFALKRYEGDWLARPSEQPFDAGTTKLPPTPRAESMRLLELFDLYAKDKALTDGDTRSTRKTVADYRSIVRRFIELCGDHPVGEIDRAMIHRYRVALAVSPAKGKGIRALTATQLIDRAQAEKLPLLGEATIRNRLRAVSAVLSFGVRLGALPENPIIAGGLSRAAAKAATKSAARQRSVKDYTRAELDLIFTSPIFQPDGWVPPRANFGRAWYWLPLLMYYTGARREELAQLRVTDVRSGEGGIPYLDILDEQEEGDGDRGVKTEGSRRFIPLHSDLIDRGFLKYKDGLPSDGQLFPLLKASPAGYFGANFGKRWAEYLRTTVGLKTTASPSHGFRHTFKTLCREVSIPEDVQDAITGHAASGSGRISRSYGRMPLKTMANALKRYPLAIALNGRY